jgi:hypothetical protein
MKKSIFALVVFSSLLGLGSAEASYVAANDATGNGSMATALNLNSYFDKTFDANIGKFDTTRNNSPVTNISTTFFHASVNATTATAGSMDWYSFTTTTTGVQAYFDIDTTTNLNSWIKLYNAAGVQIGSNNNRTAQDPGTSVTTDSYLSSVLANTGLYFVSVGRALSGAQAGLIAGQSYALHVSLATAPGSAVTPTAVPVPSAMWLFGSGIAGLMICFASKKTVAASLPA